MGVVFVSRNKNVKHNMRSICIAALLKCLGMSERVYLVWEGKYKSLCIPVLKIGGTGETMKQRMGGYPKDSEILCYCVVRDYKKVEANLKKVFNELFTLETGKEWFRGDFVQMKQAFIKCVADEYAQEAKEPVNERPVATSSSEEIEVKGKASRKTSPVIERPSPLVSSDEETSSNKKSSKSPSLVETKNVKMFVKTNCETGEEFSVKSKHLYESYLQWCHDMEFKTVSKKQFESSVSETYEMTQMGVLCFLKLRIAPKGEMKEYKLLSRAYIKEKMSKLSPELIGQGVRGFANFIIGIAFFPIGDKLKNNCRIIDDKFQILRHDGSWETDARGTVLYHVFDFIDIYELYDLGASICDLQRSEGEYRRTKLEIEYKNVKLLIAAKGSEKERNKYVRNVVGCLKLALPQALMDLKDSLCN